MSFVKKKNQYIDKKTKNYFFKFNNGAFKMTCVFSFLNGFFGTKPIVFYF